MEARALPAAPQRPVVRATPKRDLSEKEALAILQPIDELGL